MMSPAALFLIPLAVAGLSAALLWPIVRKLFGECNADEITSEWLESFSPASYYPMQGLLAEEDFRFLSRQPGFDLSLYKKLRRERLLIFRQYLIRLILDFNRLHAAARLLLAHSHEDHSDFVTRLVFLKVRFSFAVIHAELSYLLCRLGFRSLAVRAMILRLEEMTAQLSSISSTDLA